MIWESEYWKKPLLRLANKLSKWREPRAWNEQDLVSLEKDLFFAFYSIRKLMDAKKLSDTTSKMKVNISIYPNKGKDVTFFNWHQLENLYDFASKRTEERDLLFICNQIIHSYVFMPDINENNVFEGISFCSDYERNKNLYALERTELINLLRIVGKDYPSFGQYIFNPDKHDYDITNY